MSGEQEGSKGVRGEPEGARGEWGGARGSKGEQGGVRGSKWEWEGVKGEQAVFEKKFIVEINVTPWEQLIRTLPYKKAVSIRILIHTLQATWWNFHYLIYLLKIYHVSNVILPKPCEIFANLQIFNKRSILWPSEMSFACLGGSMSSYDVTPMTSLLTSLHLVVIPTVYCDPPNDPCLHSSIYNIKCWCFWGGWAQNWCPLVIWCQFWTVSVSFPCDFVTASVKIHSLFLSLIETVCNLFPIGQNKSCHQSICVCFLRRKCNSTTDSIVYSTSIILATLAQWSTLGKTRM